MQNGTVTGPDTAKEDDEVTLTITPAAGYVLESISVTGVTTENAVEVTDGKFTMPAEDVNVIATFKSVTYAITVKEGTEDAANWTISPNPAAEDATVTIKYNGTKKVKSIKAVKKAAAAAAATDLSALTADYEAQDGDVLTGTLNGSTQPYKITIADKATVTLEDLSIIGTNNENYEWAGITCAGDATIILKGTNSVTGFYQDYPGIQAGEPSTKLTIKGDGSLDASSIGHYAAGIGCGHEMNCGTIVIEGGNITAKGGEGAAGIGSGHYAVCDTISITGGTVNAQGGNNGAGIGCGTGMCGTIIIEGGTVTAKGGEGAAGIGCGAGNSCATITITGGTVIAQGGTSGAGIGSGFGAFCEIITIASTVTSVTATKGENAPNSIGAGENGYCEGVNIAQDANVTQN